MSSADSPVVVVTAIREELDPILRHFDRLEEKRVARLRVYRTGGCRAPLVLAATGDGPSRARSNAGELCDLFHPKALLGVGVAGALTRSLAPLDLVAAAQIRNGSGDRFFADPILFSVATANGALPGVVVTVPAPVVSAVEKESLARSLPSGERAAVDMESAAWAEAAAHSKVPFLAVRAIADAAGEELPGYLTECLGPEGGIRRTAVLRRAAARPFSLLALLRMRRRVLECGEKLASFIWDFFDCERW